VSRRAELLALLVSDAFALILAYVAFVLACQRWGWLDRSFAVQDLTLITAALLCTGWLILFLFAGMYQERFAGSRFDESVTLLKVVTVGSLLLFFSVFIDRMGTGSARVGIGFYWGALVVAVATGRLGVRAVQKAFILRGHGLHKAIVVGWSERVEELYKEVARYPAAGLQIVGAVRLQHPVPLRVGVPAGPDDASLMDRPAFPEGDALPEDGVEIALNGGAAGQAGHRIADLPGLIDRLDVKDVLIALGPGDHAYLDDVLRVCDGRSVALKLVPDFYSAIGGMARTEHMYGLPLIEVFPEPIPAWEKSTKRFIDILVSLVVLVAGLPLWLAVGALVRLTSPGPAIYRQTRVGQYGERFTMYKFRTMYENAEEETGPVWAQKNDARVTPLGRMIRRIRLDEIPQLWNVMRGEMSLVGPRPERPFFVEQHVSAIPLYSRRHRVKPGVTGLAQVKWRYDNDLDDVRQKLKYDLFYIENMSLRMDAKILLQTTRTAVGAGGH